MSDLFSWENLKSLTAILGALLTLLAHLVYHYLRKWHEQKLEQDRVLNAQRLEDQRSLNEKFLNELSFQDERRGHRDVKLVEALAGLHQQFAIAVRAKLTLIHANGDKSDKIQTLTTARNEIKNQAFQSLFAPPQLIEMVKQLDAVLAEPTTDEKAVVIAYAKIRDYLRKLAGLAN